MDSVETDTTCKVPEVVLAFWLIKIFATTLGETAGDALSMSLNLGYVISSVIFGVVFLVAVAVQIRAKKFHAQIYWITIVATTTLGTTMADFFDRSLGIGYAGGSAILLGLLGVYMLICYFTADSLSIHSIHTTKSEALYWGAIMLSQTLGTALGDWTADEMELGYGVSAIIFGSLLVLMALLYYFTKAPRTLLFWSAFILSRPLGAVVGDFLDKPVSSGGLAFDRFTASGILLTCMVVISLFFPLRAAKQAH